MKYINTFLYWSKVYPNEKSVNNLFLSDYKNDFSKKWCIYILQTQYSRNGLQVWPFYVLHILYSPNQSLLTLGRSAQLSSWVIPLTDAHQWRGKDHFDPWQFSAVHQSKSPTASLEAINMTIGGVFILMRTDSPHTHASVKLIIFCKKKDNTVGGACILSRHRCSSSANQLDALEAN